MGEYWERQIAKYRRRKLIKRISEMVIVSIVASIIGGVLTR